jgi:hypothetical protein
MKQALLNFHLEEFKGVIRSRKLKDRQHNDQKKLEAQWAEPVSLTFHSALRKLNTEPSTVAFLVSDWLISKESSPLKPLCQMNQNMVGCIYGRFSIKNTHFVPIH